MSVSPSGSDASVPTLTVGSRRQQRAGRRAHPAGTGERQGLSRGALEAIAIGLVRTAPYTDHKWTEGRLRRYTQLVDTDLYDAWLIHWSPSSSLELHDHGGSQGVVAVATGTLIETYSDLRWSHPLRIRVLDEKGTVTIPATRVHEVYNPGPASALSVHVYSPRLKSMTFYDPRPVMFLNPISRAEGDLASLEETAAHPQIR